MGGLTTTGAPWSGWTASSGDTFDPARGRHQKMLYANLFGGGNESHRNAAYAGFWNHRPRKPWILDLTFSMVSERGEKGKVNLDLGLDILNSVREC